MIEINSLKHVHLVGIGGIGVSALAEILLNKDIKVSGSDIHSSEITRHLETLGANIIYEHSGENINSDIDLLVYTSAVNDSNPELKKAKELSIPLMSRSEMQGLIMKDFKFSIAIAGAHGKTTTTSMTSVIFNHTEIDPTVLIGAVVPEIGGNAKIGKGNVLITEACEYKENFLDFHYTTAVILNIDEDHLDYFENLNHIVEAFAKFANQLPKKGHLIINNDDYNAKKILSYLTVENITTYGISNESNYTAKNITYSDLGTPKFDVSFNGELLGRIELSIPGRHNIYNSLAAISISHAYGIEFNIIKESLQQFKGALRRFEFKGNFKGCKIIDDYAHHPNEIKATLEAAKKIQNKKIIVAFQPHTYTRTKELLNEFSLAFENADEVIITDIYSARETDDLGIHSTDLTSLISKTGKKATYFSTFEEVRNYLEMKLDKDTIFFTMGAGDIYKLGELILE
ncbi:MAG: UDP-N-acetylmuramate--L-alanine ligase [Clostridiales bacterium]|nr:UDP-N-acetylmuramate--L-alanine ligase [Clostridiales bacterium]